MDSCVERILEAISSLGIDQKSFAQMIGVRPQTITDWKNGKTLSYKRYIEKIAEVLDTTTEYLLTGTGPKHRTSFTVPAKWADVSNDQIKAAFFEGAGDLTKEEMDSLWADAQDYMRYKLEQRRKRQE